jgi:hypothetical protein
VANDVYALTRRAFQEMLKMPRLATDIIFNGKKKKCVTGAVWRNNKQEIVAALGQSRTQVEMLATDFDALGEIVSSQSVVLIQDLVMAVHAITRDETDPCVHFIAVGDHATQDSGPASGESGFVNLAIGQVVVPVQFLSRKSSPNYVFAVLEIENVIDANPMFIGIVPVARTIDTFTLNLDAAPDTVNYVLRWKVVL